MPIRETIVAKLSAEFAPSHLEVIDESESHRGHAGWHDGGETHFRVKIASAKFAGQSRLARHRAVLDTLDSELRGGVHALAIEVLSEPAAPAPGGPA